VLKRLLAADRIRVSDTIVTSAKRPGATADGGRRAQMEAERSAIARLLHDGIGQPMTSLLIEVDRAREVGSVPSDILDRIENLAQAALRNARQVVLEVSATEDARGPLKAARAYSESILAIGGCELVWEAMPDVHDLPVETARHLAAVIRESVTNIARHAAAKTIHVRLVRDGASIVVTVEDDGLGLAPRLAGAPRDPGYGLRANQELAEALGGSFTVQPRFGGGTVVRFEAKVGQDD
jgi:signal transduction histidine kinase